jgi:hypothetical protein
MRRRGAIEKPLRRVTESSLARPGIHRQDLLKSPEVLALSIAPPRASKARMTYGHARA